MPRGSWKRGRGRGSGRWSMAKLPSSAPTVTGPTETEISPANFKIPGIPPRLIKDRESREPGTSADAISFISCMMDRVNLSCIPLMPSSYRYLPSSTAPEKATLKRSASNENLAAMMETTPTTRQHLQRKAKLAKYDEAYGKYTPQRAVRKRIIPVIEREDNEFIAVYCICRDAQNDEKDAMVECSNDMCPFEWHHFLCVGENRAEPPHGDWYCPNCRDANNKKKPLPVIELLRKLQIFNEEEENRP